MRTCGGEGGVRDDTDSAQGFSSRDPTRSALTTQKAWGELALLGRRANLPSALGKARVLSLWYRVRLDAQETGCANKETPHMVVPSQPGP